MAPPAVITTDLRLNETRYVTRPNNMKTKTKQMDIKNPEQPAVTSTHASRTLRIVDPPKHSAVIKVSDTAMSLEYSKMKRRLSEMNAPVIAEHDNASVKVASFTSILVASL